MRCFLLVILLAGVFLSTALAAGCTSAKIGDILDNFPQYERKGNYRRGHSGRE